MHRSSSSEFSGEDRATSTAVSGDHRCKCSMSGGSYLDGAFCGWLRNPARRSALVVWLQLEVCIIYPLVN